jgi:hypothetical protein
VRSRAIVAPGDQTLDAGVHDGTGAGHQSDGEVHRRFDWSEACKLDQGCGQIERLAGIGDCGVIGGHLGGFEPGGLDASHSRKSHEAQQQFFQIVAATHVRHFMIQCCLQFIGIEHKLCRAR